MKKILIAAGLLSAAAIAGASLSVAQGYYGEPAPYGSSLDYSPNLDEVTPGTPAPYENQYGYYGGYGGYYGYHDDPYRARGGPGPRVGNGTGMGIGSQR
ncbi:MAG TPA: hypothetical protein VH206_01920 [Xanthobacteraceae bacterium]|jgi:hypothetical protein|nr:hypothetical protein [Xanthobacteraceae bacterium]